MRLLERKANGEVVLSEHVGNDVPSYAILSHTWATDNREEVIFQDLEAGTGKCKAGYGKINFCADKAAADGLRHFWIDTCCIDRRNAVELAEAINSMFRWYQKATRCYVYLSDVSAHDDGEQYVESGIGWESAFRKSRWFTRGWTLQELIAPTLVDFFSSEGERLGTKLSLELMIHEITGIARNALRGDTLPDFSIEERMSWAKHRNTKLEEDQIYSLLGIFGVSMALIYGEGRDHASRRLQEEIQKSYKGTDFEQFTVGLDLSTIPEAARFVAREKELIKMHKLLHGHNTRSAVVLHGLGGMGKTQLAIAYAKRHKEKYTAILWLNANDEDSLKLSFRHIAQQILSDHPSARFLANVDLEGQLDQVVNAVKAWLSLRKNARWLVIYDNHDNPRSTGSSDRSAVDIRQYFPKADHGSIIVTTRSSQVTQGERLHIRKLPSVQEGLEVLSNTSGRKVIESDSDAIALIKELDGLPLALSTAGAYLENVTTSFSEYLQLYEASWLKLQQMSPQLSSYEDRSLYTTWRVTLDRIEQQNAASAKLLKLWAYFDRQDLWFELLRHRRSAGHEWLQQLTENAESFNNAVRPLCNYGLVDPDLSLHKRVGSAGYIMHSCVHSWTQFVLNKRWDQDLASLALSCIASEIPETHEKNWWLLQQRLLQHVRRHERFILDGKSNTEGMEWALHEFGNLYIDQGKLAEAEAMYTRALQGREEALGPKHTSTLSTVNNLGLLYRAQGKLADAEAMYTRALRGREEALGLKHTSTLDTLNNLGNLYSDQGKLAEAEAMYTRALQGNEEVLGLKHTSTLDTVNNLGILYIDQCKLVEAEAMFTRALQGYEEALGPKHTSTLDTVNNLGLLYSEQGKLAEAEAMYTLALQGKEEALGPKHTSTLGTVNNLGILYSDQGKLAEAEAMYSRALQGYEEALGSKHTSILNTVNNLGNLYGAQGKLAEAEAMYTRALQGYEEALGPKHTSTLDTVNNLGILCNNQGKLAEAEAMYTRALQGYEEALGPKHTSTLDTVNNLGLLYSDQGRLADAEAMYTRALQGKEEALGSKHISTLGTVNNLGNLYSNQGKLAEAEAMYTRALQGCEEALGPKHTSTLDTVNNLGLLYNNQGKLAEAEAMYTRALQGYKEALGPKHTSTLDTVNNLGLLYSNQGKLAEAEAMYTRALQGKEETLGLKHTSTLDTVNNLGVLYNNQGKLAEAEAMYTRALQGYKEALGPKHTSTLDTVNNLGLLYNNQGKLAEAECYAQEVM